MAAISADDIFKGIFNETFEFQIIGWDNGLSPNRRQAIILTNGGIVY